MFYCDCDRLLCLVGDVAAVPGKLAGELPVVERL